MSKTTQTRKVPLKTKPSKVALRDQHLLSQTIRKNSQGILLVLCDGGLVEGKFTEGLIYTLMSTEVPIVSCMRVQGNQIGRQRQQAFDTWLDKTDFEWSLWVDSDIVITKEALDQLWEAVDVETRPVVSGTYFIYKTVQDDLMVPFPAIFSFTENKNQIAHVHPLPENSIIEVGAAGFGFIIIHRSAGLAMREALGYNAFFTETGLADSFISEDINFFMKMHEAKVPLFAHTGAIVDHLKRFPLNDTYYNNFWEQERIKDENKETTDEGDTTDG